MIRKCVICGNEFKAMTSAKYCFKCRKNRKKETRNKAVSKWHKTHPEYQKKRNIRRSDKFRVYYRKKKMEALKLLGGKCVHCGFDDERALQFDHINGGGVADNKNRFSGHYCAIIKSIKNKENKYQLLCANCNWIKRFERNEVRKRV